METEGSGAVRRALITGASRGIGRAIAFRLAREGYAIGVNFRSSAREAEEVVRGVEERGGRAAAFQADMADEEQAADLVERVETVLGPLDAVIANAGITRDRLVVQMSEGDWNATWLTDLAGPRRLCEKALSRMAQRRAGRLVTVSSVVAVTGNAGQANYAAAKAALQGLTRQLAVRAAPAGVTVNCVIPGYIRTDAVAHLTDEQRAVWLSRIPMGRDGTVEDIANLVAYLAGSAAGYITGQCIAVDGGLLARAGHGFSS